MGMVLNFLAKINRVGVGSRRRLPSPGSVPDVVSERDILRMKSVCIHVEPFMYCPIATYYIYIFPSHIH